MLTIDVLGRPCPIPVISAKRELGKDDVNSVLVQVDNIVAVQNLEKLAKGMNYLFSYQTLNKNHYDVIIEKKDSVVEKEEKPVSRPMHLKEWTDECPLVVAISKDFMGNGSEELGKILIKGFIYSLTVLKTPPAYILFFNSGVLLNVEGKNTVQDLKTLEEKGSIILSCGTCWNYYSLQGNPATGEITDMYGIVEKLAEKGRVINI